jgi:serine phosphatase RsbU (regulator of sigma subunit)
MSGKSGSTMDAGSRSPRRSQAAAAAAGWQIVLCDGDAPIKKARVRDEARIQAVLRHVHAQECVALLGPPLSEKTHLLMDVAEALVAGARYAPLYLDLWETRSSDEAAFFASAAELIDKALGLSTRNIVPPLLDPAGTVTARHPEGVRDARSFQNYLTGCVQLLDRHLALLIDHLQALPHDLVHGLLLALRSAYMEQDLSASRQLVAVVSGGMNLVGLSTGSTSPFNIAKPVAASHLSPEQTRALARATFEAFGCEVSGGALAGIQEWAGGDAYLVSVLCADAAKAVRGHGRAQVTLQAVNSTARRLWGTDRRPPPIREAIRMIEEDPDTMLDVLHLLDHGYLPRSRSRQAITRTGTDRLQLSGAVVLCDGDYCLKNRAYREALARHFTAERVGHVLRIAGRWNEAIDYLAPRLAAEHRDSTGAMLPLEAPALGPPRPAPRHSAARPQLLEAVVQSLYAADSLERAGEILAHGLRSGFSLEHVAIYRTLPAEGLLERIYPQGEGGAAPAIMDMQAPGAVEAQTLRYGNYALRGTADEARLVVALTTRFRPIGVLTVERYVEHRDPHELPTELPDLLRFLQHAAGAMENVMFRSAYRAIGQAVLSASTLQATVCRVLGAVSEALGCDFAHLYLMDATGTWIEMAAGIGRLWKEGSQTRARFQRTGRHPVVACLADRRMLTTRGTDPRLDPGMVDRYGLRDHTLVYLPLQAGGSLLGTLELGYPADNRIARMEEGRRSLQSFGDQVAIAVHNVHLLQQTDEALARRVAELEKLRSSSLAVSSTLDLEAVLSRILHDLQALFPGAEATVWECIPGRGDLTVLQSSLTEAVYRAQRLGSDSVAGLAVATRQPQLEPDLALRPEAPVDPAVRLGLRSMSAVPLISHDRVLGAISLYAYEVKSGISSGGETELLQAFAAQAALALDNARLHREELARQRLEDELVLARRIQLSMLPTACPAAPGWEIAAAYEAARTVGGDFYDFYDLPGSPARLGMTVADVSGKGVPAAIFMGLSRTIIRTTALSGRGPASALLRANELILKDSRSELFLSVFYAVLELDTGRVIYANGGHNRPLWYHATTREIGELAARGTILGIFEEIPIEESRIDLAPGDCLVLYTDGVTEAVNPDGEMFGEERLIAVVAAHADAGADLLRARIVEALAEFTAGADQADDITCLVVKRSKRPAGNAGP